MRARNIKPSLFKNEVLGTADPLLTILFEGLWCEADRDGRLEDRPLRLKAEIFPYRNNADIDAMLNWLRDNGFISRYEASGTKVIQVLKFSEHQRPHNNEVVSVLPAFDASKHNQGAKRAQPRKKASTTKETSTSLLMLDTDSLILIPDSGSLDADCLMVPPEPLSSAKPPDDVQTVFEHWQKTHGHERAVLDPKRRKLIADSLKLYSLEHLCQVITGYLNSPFHMGENDSRTKHDSIELMLRDGKHIDIGYAAYTARPTNGQSTLTRKNIAATEGWMPPEIRNAKH